MTERELLPRLRSYFDRLPSAAVELKMTKTNSLPFSALAEHQRKALLHVKHKSLFFKIPDGGYAQTPFDAFVLTNAPAYVCVVFYRPRKPITPYFIDIDAWCEAEAHNGRKSLTEEEAQKIQTIVRYT